MSSRRRRRHDVGLKLAVTILLVAVGCFGGVFFGINSYPRLLVSVLGLEPLGSPAQAVPVEQAALDLRGESLDRVDFILPPQIAEPRTLTAASAGEGRPEGVPLIGDASRMDTTSYLLTIGEDAANELLRDVVLPEGADRDRYQNVIIDLHPGGLTVYADVNLGIRRQRFGLLLLQGADELMLSARGIVLDGKLYAMPKSGSLARLLLPIGGRTQRSLSALTVVGPLPGEARAEAARFHNDSLQVLARATYASSALPDTGWRILEPGLALREMDITPGAERPTERLSIVRLSPAEVQLRVYYDPVSPRRISEWGDTLSPLLVVNGSYFAPEGEGGYETIGLLVSDGQRWGTPLRDYAGMLAVTEDGHVSVRWLRDQPYTPGEPLIQAMQSFPVLVKPGGIMGFPADADDSAPARRTVVAQDVQGNLLLIVAPRGTLSLHELAVFLAESDLGINVALNLDGGRSTGLRLAAGDAQVEIDSLTPVPSVIAVERR